MKKFLALVLSYGCIVVSALAQPKSITILHTNDMHASFLPHEAFWVRSMPKPMIGGFNEMWFALDSLRKIRSTSILLDAGDVMTGNPVTEYDYHGAQGGVLFEMMNRLGYDAWCPGNHDLDISQANLIRLSAIARFPTLSANLVDGKGTFPVHNIEYTIIEKNGVRIGIIGIITKDLFTLVNQNNLTDLTVLPTVATTQRLIDTLISKTDIVVAVTHQGVEDDSVLAANVHGLNVIIGGHSHTRLKRPKIVNGILICQTGSNCENLGVLDLTVENHAVTKSWGILLPLNFTSDRPKTDFSQLIDSVQQGIDRDYREVIGTLQKDWQREDGESGIGNFITDAQREEAKADIGFMNNHGIRKNVSAGPLTKRDLFEVLPFRNVLVTFQLNGKQIREILIHSIKERPQIQTSGILCTWKRGAAGGIELVHVTINGQPLQDEKMYVAAASDYLVGEAQHYLGITIDHPDYSKQTVFEAVEKKVKTEKTISSAIEHRIVEIK